MKKNGLLKVIFGVFALVILLTFIIPTTSGERSYLGIGQFVMNIIQSLAFFTDPVLLIIVIGGFYGVLNKTDGYKKILDKIALKYKDNRNFIIFIILAFSKISFLLFSISLFSKDNQRQMALKAT